MEVGKVLTLTPEYIDSYPMTDGLASTQSSVFDAQNPWKNRGPRFESTYYIAGISTVNGLPFEVKHGSQHQQRYD